MNEKQRCFNAVRRYFRGDKARTEFWFLSNNPHLNGRPPAEFLQAGDFKSVYSALLEGGNPDNDFFRQLLEFW